MGRNEAEEARRALKAAIDRREDISMQSVSQHVDRNNAYIQQYIERGHPKWLPEDVRKKVSSLVGIPESALKPRELSLVRNNPSLPPRENPDSIDPPDDGGRIEELNIRAASGAGGLEETAEGGPLWHFPREWLRVELQARSADLKIITVYGDSMMSDPPSRRDLEPGDKIIVNTSDVIPTPPGVFIIYDGLGLVAKRLEHIADSDPTAVRILSNNAQYTPYERTLEEVKIWGRVVGRWQRL